MVPFTPTSLELEIFMATYTVFADELKAITKKIQHIINKCVKHNVEYKYSVGDAYNKTVTLDGTTYNVSLVDIDLDVKFKLNGWHSLGCVQRKDGIVQCYFDDCSLIEKYKDTKFQCEHCGKKVHRNSVVILENEQHEQKVVGTSCVKEFTSGLDGKFIAEVNEYMYRLRLSQFDEETLQFRDDVCSHCRSCGTVVYNALNVISTAKRIIDQYGFEPAGNTNATWKLVQTDYSSSCIEEEAKLAIEWIKSLDSREINNSNYLFNLRQIIDADYCTSKHFGLLTSIIPAYRKSKSISNKHSENTSEYVGNIGDKISVTVHYTKTFWYNTNFGTTSYIHLFSDNKGNIFKWTTGKSIVTSDGRRIPEDASIELVGKIKDHSEYHNQKQTVLTRCKYRVLA